LIYYTFDISPEYSFPPSPPPTHHHSFPTRRSSDLATVKFASAFAGETEGQTQRIREVVKRMEEVAGIADTAAQGAEQTSAATEQDRKSTRLNSSHQIISYAVFCLKKKKMIYR